MSFVKNSALERFIIVRILPKDGIQIVDIIFEFDLKESTDLFIKNEYCDIITISGA